MSVVVCLIFDAVIPSTEEMSNALSGFDRVHPDHSEVVVVHNDRALFIMPDWEDHDDGSIETIRYEWPQHTLPAYPRLVSIESRDESLIMAVVRQLAARWTFLISTGRDEDYTSSAFAARFDAEPDWKLGPYVSSKEDHSVPVHRIWPPRE